MKISELPTPRLRARAIELAKLDRFDDVRDDMELEGAFMWADSEERALFWLTCYEGNWDEAKELQPSLFKPMDGKPHIKLVPWQYDEDLGVGKDWTLDVVNHTEVDSVLLKFADHYHNTIHPNFYPTIQEAVNALYSFKREEKTYE